MLTISFSDVPVTLMTGAGEALRRDGVEAMSDETFAAGQPVFAAVDADAVTTAQVLFDTQVRFLSVLDGRRLVGLVDVARLRDLCRPRNRNPR